VGVTDPLDPRVETAEEVRDRVLEAAEFLPLDRLGTTDDCGFSPFGDDTSTARETAFAKIRARVEGTALAAAELGV
jgi:5-methyltetrahydropteroyltriglutamate--homocysteine methyltransferase